VAQPAHGPELCRMMSASDRQQRLQLIRLRAFTRRGMNGFPRTASPDRSRGVKRVTWYPARSASPSLCRLYVIGQVKPLDRGQAGRGRPPPQARTAVRSQTRPRQTETRRRPGGRLNQINRKIAWHADGTTLVTASSRGQPHVMASPKGIPPTWLETFAIHPAAGVR